MYNPHLKKWLETYSENGFKLCPVYYMEKRPAITQFLKRATSDLEELLKWSKMPAHSGGSWGLCLAPSGLVAIDVDTKHDGLATWEQLTEKHGEPKTLKAKSGGGGLHYVFKAKPGVRYVGKINSGIDVRHNHIIVVQPSKHPKTGLEYEWCMPIENAVQDYPPWIADLIEKKIVDIETYSADTSDEELRALVEEIQQHELEYDEWVHVGMALHSVMPNQEGLNLYLQATKNYSYQNGDYEKAKEKWDGFSTDLSSSRIGIGTIVYILKERGGDLSKFNLAKDKKIFQLDFNQYDLAKLSKAKIEGGAFVFDSKNDLVEAVNNLNFFYISEAAGDCVGKFIEDPSISDADFILFSQRKLKTDLAPLKLKVRSDKPSFRAGDLVWIESKNRKVYSRIRFSPESKVGELNLWKPLQIAPKNENCDDFLRMIFESLCSGNQILNDFLLDWFAHLIQKPAEKSATIPVLFSEHQGTGKNLLCDFVMRQILGKMHLKTTDMNELAQRFNSHMAYKLLTFIDELSWAQSSKAISFIKALSGSGVMNVEYKHAARITVENYSRYILATNSETSVPIEKGNRRFVFIEGSTKFANDSKFFEPILSRVKTGYTASAFLWHLQSRDISEFNPNRIPDHKNLGVQTKLRTQGDVAKFWYDLYFNDPRPIFVEEKGLATDLCFAKYQEFSRGAVKANHLDFWAQSKRVMPILQTANLKQHRSGSEGLKFRTYSISPSEAMVNFCATMGFDEPLQFDQKEFFDGTRPLRSLTTEHKSHSKDDF